MRATFADTFAYLALINPRDAAYETAMAEIEKIDWQIVTTEWVLTEVADAMSAQNDRGRFLALLETLETDPNVEIVPATRELIGRGIELYRQRPDKDWPLTDCFSFVVMEDLGITEALTADKHFKQAGFAPLLAES